MSMSRALAPHLPYLRRYARALTGSQVSGDAYVRASLTALLEGDESIGDNLTPQIGLYRLFHRIWSSSGGGMKPSEDPATLPDGPEGRLMTLAAEQRAALLLTAVEGFTLEEAGRILDTRPERIERAIIEAQRAIENELASKVLIIEDEPIIALDLENLITELGHEVVATAATSDQAVQLAITKKPGLILADINLGDGGSGLEAVGRILQGFDIPVIFVTAYPEKLLTGERPEPTYLIAKPFMPEAVQATVGQALFFHPMTRKAQKA